MRRSARLQSKVDTKASDEASSELKLNQVAGAKGKRKAPIKKAPIKPTTKSKAGVKKVQAPKTVVNGSKAPKQKTASSKNAESATVEVLSDSVIEVSESSEEFNASASSEVSDSDDLFMPEASNTRRAAKSRTRTNKRKRGRTSRGMSRGTRRRVEIIKRNRNKTMEEVIAAFSGPDSDSDSEDSPLTLFPSDDSDVPLAELQRRKIKQHIRENRYKKEPYENTVAYYMRNPTKDPRVLMIHPEIESVWSEMDKIEVIEVKEDDQPSDLKLKLLPFQKEGLHWMKKQELSEFKGGILADEMGMGKTIQMISLLLSEPRGKPNLIIAPTVALMQWKSEIQTHTSSLKVLMYHGFDRTKSVADFQNYDVILTTYSIIESGFRKQNYGFKRKGELVKEDSIIHQTNWFRVILDEGHYIKDRACNTARAVFSLTAERKWALSGTPLQNRVGELYSLIRFLKADPFSYYFCKKCPCKSLSWKFHNNRICADCGHSPMNHFCWWNADILKPIQNLGNVGEGGKSFQKLGKLLDRIMLRRTKIQKADDLGLPPRVVTVRRDVFNEEEEDMYTSLFSDSKRKFTTYVEEGTVLNHYANIFELITKMRLAVNHPDLILKRLPTKTGSSIENANMKNQMVCVVCQDEAEDPIVSKCKHIFCREDARQFLDSSIEAFPKCPSCFVALTIDLSQPTVVEDDGKELLKAQAASNDPQNPQAGEIYRGSIVNRINMNSWRSSTKIEALVEELDQLRSQDHTIKSIVFSQFVNFLDLVHWRLTRAGFACCRLDGRMSPAQRDAIIKTFMQRHEYTVFLISLKAGGIALNLTEASRVFLCDPWWNPAVEDQAMDRIHRLGQHRPIKITRLVVENSIESRIIQLQAKKHALFQSTIGKDTTALARLTEEDLKFLFVL